MDAAGKSLAILFSQISGAAALYESLGNRKAADMVSEALNGLRAAVERHGGTVVKTMGDELIARVDGADQALQAGFTVGPVIEDRQDVFGDTVNVASRLAAMANPKQVLTTRQAVDRLAPLPRSTCRSLYTTAVKGRSEKISVYEVIWAHDKSTTAVGDVTDQRPAAPVAVRLSWRGQAWNMGEEIPNLAAGRIGLGQSVDEIGEDAISYEIG